MIVSYGRFGEDYNMDWESEYSPPPLIDSGGSSGSGGESSDWNIPWAEIIKFGTGLLHPPKANEPQQTNTGGNYYQPRARPRISTGTIIGIAGGAAGLLLLTVALASRK